MSRRSTRSSDVGRVRLQRPPPLVLDDKNPAKEPAERQRHCIFTIGSPPIQESQRKYDVSEDRREGFLDACAYCEKKIIPKESLLMYGYLQAFYSPDCREKRMELDRELNPPSPLSKQIKNLEFQFIENVVQVLQCL